MGLPLYRIRGQMLNLLPRLGRWRRERPSAVAPQVAADTRESPPPVEAARREDAARVRSAVATLTGRRREIVERMYGLDGGPEETGGEIARRVGCSHQNITEVARLGRDRVCLALRGGAR